MPQQHPRDSFRTCWRVIRGHVAITASALGLATLPRLAPSCASKYAVVARSEALHSKFSVRDSGVRVTVVCPA
jgi:short-subunit dehydrogenase